MKTKTAIASLILPVLITLGCSPHYAIFDGMVPASATSVEHIDRSKYDYGLKYHVVSSAYSYRYVDAVRQKLVTNGYRLCDKSAISKWAQIPAKGDSSSGMWINELYVTDRSNKFVLLRVDSFPILNTQNWDQKFLVAAQVIQDGQQNMSNIKEFCG